MLEGCGVFAAVQRSLSAAKVFFGCEARIHGFSSIAVSHRALLLGKTRAELSDRQKIGQVIDFAADR
jgi:hypothetical protein